MNVSPSISVIIPVFNGAAYLAEALQSVFAQEYSPLEVVVADDGSSDDSSAIARSFPGVTCLALAHAGVSAARNAAVLASSGEWLAFLDADDIWLPGKLAAQVSAAARECADLVLCEGTAKFEDVPAWFVWPADESKTGTCFEPSAWLVSRTAFDEVGPFQPGRTIGEDANWLMRAMARGVKHTVVAQPYVIRRIHSASASSQIRPEDFADDSRHRLILLREWLAIKRAVEAPHG